MKNKIETLYLDWFNNFLTVERFAEYYGMPVDKAHKVIRIGRYLNHRRGWTMVIMSVILIASGLYAVWESEKIIQEKHDKRNNDE